MRNTRILLFLFAIFLIPDLLIKAQDELTDQYYSGNYQEVIQASASLIASGDTAFNTFYLKALSEAQQGQLMQAIATLRKALTYYPSDSGIKRMLARQFFDAGNYVQAYLSYDQLVRRDSADVSSWLKLAEISSFSQKYDKAIEALNQVLVLDSMNLSSLMMMGDILKRINSSSAAIYYDRAYRLYPENQRAAFALGNWYIQSKEAWRTIPICKQMLEMDSTSIKFSKLLAYAYYKTGEPGQATEWFNYSVSLGDSSVFTLKFKGISHYLKTDFAQAIGALEDAVKKDTTDAEIHFFLGASLSTIAEMDQAMYHLNQSLRLMCPDPSVVSRIYSEQGNIKRLETAYEDAYSLYEKAWNADSTNAISLYYMASIQDNSMHQHKEALVNYQRFIDALDKVPEKEEGNQGVSIRAIVEDRIITLKEEMFFRDE